MAEYAVRCRSLYKSYGDVVAVNGVTFDVERGELLCLLGPSGCGKTTVLRLVAGLERLDDGVIEIAGRRVADRDLHLPPEQRKVGMVFQDFALFPHLTVAENVAYGLRGRRSGERIRRLLDLVGLGHCADRMPHELSGGQQQRLALARALGPEPHIVLLDEPFSNLDQNLRRHLRQEVRAILAEAGTTAIFVTHDQEEALSMSDRLALMWDGQLVQLGTPQEVYFFPATKDVANFLGEANFIPAQAGDGVVRCELGAFPAPAWLKGDVEVMFRPEALILQRDAQGTAVVVAADFFGHDQLVKVRTDSGLLLDVRVVGFDQMHVGQRVRIAVHGTPMIFERERVAANGHV